MSIRIPVLLTLSVLVSQAQTPFVPLDPTGAAIVGVPVIPASETTSLSPGHTQRDPLVVNNGTAIVLTAPGTYTAPSWAINGQVRLATPGNYTVVASTGSIIISRTASILGPLATGGFSKRLTFAHAGDFSFGASWADPDIDIAQGTPPVLDAPPLVNISTRATIVAGQTHTSGFVVGGKVARNVLVRAIGPTLGTFGVANALATPLLTVLSHQLPIRTNSGWNADPLLETTFSAVGAFPLPANSRDAAMLLTLIPGSYTVQVAGGSGEMLLEIYYVD